LFSFPIVKHLQLYFFYIFALFTLQKYKQN